MFSTNTILRAIVSFLDTPIKVILLVFIVFTLFYLGTFIAEITQRAYIKDKAERIIDSIKLRGESEIVTIIRNSEILSLHKQLLLEVTKHKNISDEMLRSLAASLLENYNIEQESIIKKTDIIIKLGPTFGLLGTLTPLGPGIIALSNGDTQTLSSSLLVAFDTTVVGLICASVCTIISSIRRKWYSKDRVMLTLIMEAIVESL